MSSVILGLTERGVVKTGEINIQDEGYRSYANLWYLDNRLVIVEPYVIHGDGSRIYYNRIMIDSIDLEYDVYIYEDIEC